jgi:hypothetical protein
MGQEHRALANEVWDQIGRLMQILYEIHKNKLLKMFDNPELDNDFRGRLERIKKYYKKFYAQLADSQKRKNQLAKPRNPSEAS